MSAQAKASAEDKKPCETYKNVQEHKGIYRTPSSINKFNGITVQVAVKYIRMVYEFKDPVPVVTELGPGYAWYMRDGGTWENDIFTVVLEHDGSVKHFRSDQIHIHKNGTFGIFNNN